MKQFIIFLLFVINSLQLDCDCTTKFKDCPSCTDTPNQEQYKYLMDMMKCGCKKDNCPPCDETQNRDTSDIKEKKEVNSDYMAKQAQEQVRLYKLANQYALESQEHKDRANEAKKLMDEAIQKSDIAKQKMNLYLHQAKDIAQKLFKMQTDQEIGDKNINQNFLV